MNKNMKGMKKIEGMKRMMQAAAVVVALLMICSLEIGCGREKYDGRLEAVSAVVNEHPDSALDMLRVIDAEALAAGDRHLYDLLTIKAKDKAYVEHESDSLILDVMAYFESHVGATDSLRAEARYYGGRVYADLGDYPTALRYFQSALELLPEGTPYRKLRGNVLSQTGGLLDELRLYDETIPYVKASIELCKEINDTIGESHDFRLLGGIYRRNKKYDEAEGYLHQSLELSKSLPIDFEQAVKMNLADLKFHKLEIDSALLLIRDVVNTKNQTFKNNALALAVKIYYYADKPDTAFMYAKELVRSKDPTKRDFGYHYLLSQKLRGFSGSDSLLDYIIEYRELLEKFYNENQNQMALQQQTLYNYNTHEKKRKEVELMNAKLRIWLLSTLCILLLLAIILLYIKNRVNRQKLKLHVALENIKELNERLHKISENKMSNNESDSINNQQTDECRESKDLTIQDLRKILRDELVLLSKSKSASELSMVISESIAYVKLQRYIRQRRIIDDSDDLWIDLEKVVLKASPKFIDNLRLLTSYRLTDIELKTAFLVKCHVSPLQMSVLFNRTKSTMVSQRESICYKVFDDKLGTAIIDNIIRLL